MTTGRRRGVTWGGHESVEERDAGAVQARSSSRQVEYGSLCQTTEHGRCSRLFTERVDHPRRGDDAAPRFFSVSCLLRLETPGTSRVLLRSSGRLPLPPS